MISESTSFNLLRSHPIGVLYHESNTYSNSLSTSAKHLIKLLKTNITGHIRSPSGGKYSCYRPEWQDKQQPGRPINKDYNQKLKFSQALEKQQKKTNSNIHASHKQKNNLAANI